MYFKHFFVLVARKTPVDIVGRRLTVALSAWML